MIRRQLTVPVDAERLWDVLTDTGEIRRWFGGDMDWELREGASLHFRGDDGTEKDGRLDAVRPGRHLRFRWWPAGEGEAGAGEWGEEASEVTYLLQPLGDSTSLTVQERRLGPPRSEARASARSPGAWTAWDGRLVGAWAGSVAVSARAGV